MNTLDEYLFENHTIDGLISENTDDISINEYSKVLLQEDNDSYEEQVDMLLGSDDMRDFARSIISEDTRLSLSSLEKTKQFRKVNLIESLQEKLRNLESEVGDEV